MPARLETHKAIGRRIPRRRRRCCQSHERQSLGSRGFNSVLDKRSSKTLSLMFEVDIDLGDIKGVPIALRHVRHPEQARFEAWAPSVRWRGVRLVSKPMRDKKLTSRKLDDGQRSKILLTSEAYWRHRHRPTWQRTRGCPRCRMAAMGVVSRSHVRPYFAAAAPSCRTWLRPRWTVWADRPTAVARRSGAGDGRRLCG